MIMNIKLLTINTMILDKGLVLFENDVILFLPKCDLNIKDRSVINTLIHRYKIINTKLALELERERCAIFQA